MTRNLLWVRFRTVLQGILAYQDLIASILSRLCLFQGKPHNNEIGCLAVDVDL